MVAMRLDRRISPSETGFPRLPVGVLLSALLPGNVRFSTIPCGICVGNRLTATLAGVFQRFKAMESLRLGLDIIQQCCMMPERTA